MTKKNEEEKTEELRKEEGRRGTEKKNGRMKTRRNKNLKNKNKKHQAAVARHELMHEMRSWCTWDVKGALLQIDGNNGTILRIFWKSMICGFSIFSHLEGN